MKLFKKNRRQKKETKREEAVLVDFLGMEKGTSGVIEYTEKESSPESIEHYMLDRCETIIKTARVLDETKEEYYEVLDFINDINMMSNIDDDKIDELKKKAQRIENLKEKRDEMLLKDKEISDADYTQMREYENKIVDTINNLKSNENYQSTIKRDMGYLEGEKMAQMRMLDKLRREKKILKNLSILLFGICFVCCVLFAYLQVEKHFKMREPFLALIGAAAVMGLLIFLRLQRDIRVFKKTEVNLNYAISLLNKVKARYVSVTNAVDYTCEKFRVENSYELKYRWSKYQSVVKEKEKYAQINADIEFYQEDFEKNVLEANLKNADSWKLRPEVFIDDNELEALKYELNKRQRGLKAQMEQLSNVIRNTKQEVDVLIMRNENYSPQIRDILDKINTLCEQNI